MTQAQRVDSCMGSHCRDLGCSWLCAQRLVRCWGMGPTVRGPSVFQLGLPRPSRLVAAVAEAARVWDVLAAPRPPLAPPSLCGAQECACWHHGLPALGRFMGYRSLGMGPKKGEDRCRTSAEILYGSSVAV